jgi:hypothetical protein
MCAEYAPIVLESPPHGNKELGHAVAMCGLIDSLNGAPAIDVKGVVNTSNSAEMPEHGLAGQFHAMLRYREWIAEAQVPRRVALQSQ